MTPGEWGVALVKVILLVIAAWLVYQCGDNET